jgi:hypothetical protein
MLANSDRIDIEIDRRQVCRYLGYDADYKPPAHISSLIDEYVEQAHQLIEPAYSYIIKNIERVEGANVFIEGSIVFRSRVIVRLLEQCGKVSVFVVTIGNQLEEMASRLAKDGLVLQSVMLDVIGSDAAERVVDFVQGRIGEIANAQGLCISQRFSPGYGDWDISQQKMLFQAMNGDSAGVHLTEGCLMIPRKSVSGIIGIGLPNSNVENYNPCKNCKKYDCLNRREI